MWWTSPPNGEVITKLRLHLSTNFIETVRKSELADAPKWKNPIPSSDSPISPSVSGFQIEDGRR
jgi:hypothetical protein